jgi:hypothetical protein
MTVSVRLEVFHVSDRKHWQHVIWHVGNSASKEPISSIFELGLLR